MRHISKHFISETKARGALYLGEDQSPELFVDITYSNGFPHPIKAIFRGTKSDAAKLTRFMKPSVMFRAEINRQTYISNKVVIRSIKTTGWGDRNLDELYHDYICWLDLYELKVISDIKSESLESSFLLCGDRRFILANKMLTFNFNGDSNVTSNSMNFNFDSILPAQVKIEEHFLSHQQSKPSTTLIATGVCSLDFIYKEDSHLIPEQHSNRAREVADDFCLLCSFLSSSKVDWFINHTLHKNKREMSIKYMEEDIEPNPEETIFPHIRDEHYNFLKFARTSEICDFFSRGVILLRSHATEDFDIRLPLRYYVLACEQIVPTLSFSLLFLALEKIKDLYCKNQNRESILSKDKFKKLSKCLKDAIDNIDDLNEAERNQIKMKLAELNRDSIKSILQELFNNFMIDCADLYPAGADDPYYFLKTRNLLFHSSAILCPHMMYREAERLKILMQRLLLRILEAERRRLNQYEMDLLHREI